jgi:hypothetical protein
VKIPKKKPKRRSNSLGISLKNNLTQIVFKVAKKGASISNPVAEQLVNDLRLKVSNLATPGTTLK